MNDQLAIQYALLRGLQSSALFAGINVVLGREMMAQQVQQDAVWQTAAANGQVGVGAIIQIPTLMFPKPNSLQREREYSVGIYEEPNRNFTPAATGFAGGTMRTADDWADSVLDFMWNWRLWRASGLVPQERCVVSDARFAESGIVGVRAVCVLRQQRQQPARCAMPQIASAASANALILVAGAGAATVNGTYNLTGQTNGYNSYGRAGGQKIVWAQTGFGPYGTYAWEIQNAAGVPMYVSGGAAATPDQVVAWLSCDPYGNPNPANNPVPAVTAQAGLVVTLTVTDGSNIWYTTDGFSAPAPANNGSLPGETAALQYAAPFGVASGTILLCGAWPNQFSTAQLPSQTNDQTIQ